jgi:hypothetical protein
MAALTQRGNLDSRSQEGQLRMGLVALAMALVAAAFLARSDAATLYRVLVFAPFFVAAYGVLAAFYGTCGFCAFAGRRMTADGAEPVADRTDLAAQRKTGLWVLTMSGVCALIATVLFVIAR